MMKRILYILMMLFAAMACSKLTFVEPQPGIDDDEDGPQGRVTIHFAVDAPISTLKAKAMSDNPTDIENLYVAVFGGSGYLKEYVQAEPDSLQLPSYNGHLDSLTGRVSPVYRYRVTLALSENSRRTIHFIANGPHPEDVAFDQVTAVIPNLLSSEGKGAYWQMVKLDGIKAKRNNLGQFIDENGAVITNTNTQHYVVSDETAAALDTIALIRNFSKIEIIDTTRNNNFRLHSFAAVNVPTAGSLAPYYSEGFVENYQQLSYKALKDSLQYPGRLPITAQFNSTIPSASDFVNCTGGVVKDSSQFFYLYERPAPGGVQNPTYVIMYGYYDNPDDQESKGWYYYKVDLMEGAEYYPLYRNFKYKIEIKKILKPGTATPEEAAIAAGSGDVSSDQATQNLTDISDGQSRIVVSEMAITLVRQHTVDNPYLFSYKFFPYSSIPDSTYRNNLESAGGFVTVTKENGSVIDSLIVDSTDGPDGYRVVRIATKEPENSLKSEYLTITGTMDKGTDSERAIFRRVRVQLLNTQTMYVTCSPHRQSKEVSLHEDVTISIPQELPESMFPLVFKIEPESHTLTPDNNHSNNNLPVVADTTIAFDINTQAAKTGRTFYFTKTLSYEDYQSLTADPNHPGYVKFVCYFLTNKEENASLVFVANPFFHTAWDNFTNFRIKDFENGQLTSPDDGAIALTNQAQVKLTFTIEKDGNDLPERVYLDLSGVRPTLASDQVTITNGLIQEGTRYYFYPATSADNNNRMLCDASGNVTIYLRTTGSDGAISVSVSAEEYNTLTLQNIVPTSISLNKNSTRVGIGLTEELVASVTPSDTPYPVVWTSSDNNIATVVNGVVTGVARGTATITATAGNVSASCTVTVRRKVWHSDSYIINLKTNSTNSSSISYTTSPQNVTFTHAPRGGNNNNYYRTMGERSNFTNYNGTYTVTAPTGGNYEEARIIGLSNTYNNNSSYTVTYTSGSTTLTGTTKAGWGTTNTNSTTEVSGYDSITVTFSFTRNGTNHQLNQVTVYYGWFEWEE